jgi:Mg2+ and Co2+ transporter CorA
MNFSYLTGTLEMPAWTFWIGIATMVVAVIAQLYFFRRRGWI